MSASSHLLPEHEGLRRAVAWLAARGAWTPELVEAAARQFDLSPSDEEFLLREAQRIAAEARSRPG